METLEIQVFDTVTTFDTIVEAVRYVEKIISEWINSSEDKPLSIFIKKVANKAPPSLSINVNDTVSAKGGLV